MGKVNYLKLMLLIKSGIIIFHGITHPVSITNCELILSRTPCGKQIPPIPFIGKWMGMKSKEEIYE